MSRAAVATEAMTLEPGQTLRVVCPFCGGGSDGERSMAITLNADNGLILYICFRGHCGESGVIGNGGGSLVYKRSPPAFTPYERGDVVPVSAKRVPSWVREQLAKWRIRPEEVTHWFYSPAEDRILMPVHGPLYELRGYVRRGPPDRKPKVLTGLVDNTQPFQGWHLRDTPRTHLILVEDVPSAYRLMLNDAEAVALTGCTPSDDALDEIVRVARQRKQQVVWALDPDATSKAIKYSSKVSLRVASRVLVLDKDIKDMTDEEIYECLNALS